MPLINTAATEAKADLAFQIVALLNSDLGIYFSSNEHVERIFLVNVIIIRTHCFVLLLGGVGQ